MLNVKWHLIYNLQAQLQEQLSKGEDAQASQDEANFAQLQSEKVLMVMMMMMMMMTMMMVIMMMMMMIMAAFYHHPDLWH